MTDRLERFEKVVGELAKVEPHAWEAMIAYERVSAMTYCGLCLMSMVSIGVAWVCLTRVKYKGHGDEYKQVDEGFKYVMIVGALMTFMIVLSVTAYERLPNEAARAVSPEAALVNRMLE